MYLPQNSLDKLYKMSNDELRAYIVELGGDTSALEEVASRVYQKDANIIFTAKGVLLSRYSKVLDEPYYYGYEESVLRAFLNMGKIVLFYLILLPFLSSVLAGIFLTNNENKAIMCGMLMGLSYFLIWVIWCSIRTNYKVKKISFLINLRQRIIFSSMNDTNRIKKIEKINNGLYKLGPIWTSRSPSNYEHATALLLILQPGYQKFNPEGIVIFRHYFGKYTIPFIVLVALTGIFWYMGFSGLGFYISQYLKGVLNL